jgi:hypothetical protein
MTLYPSTTPPPPQTTAIYRDFKKSTAISKGYNVGLRYIITYKGTINTVEVIKFMLCQKGSCAHCASLKTSESIYLTGEKLVFFSLRNQQKREF